MQTNRELKQYYNGAAATVIHIFHSVILRN